MSRWRFLAPLRKTLSVLSILSILFFCLVSSAYSTPVERPHTVAELVAEFDNAIAGQSLTVGFRIAVDPGWHVYWKYAGDFGSAPLLLWQQNGQQIDPELQWPTPERIQTGPFTNYGYSKEVYFLADLDVPDSVNTTTEVHLDAEWLVCKEECIPGIASFDLQLPVVPASVDRKKNEHTRPIQKTRSNLPLRGYEIEAQIHSITSDHLIIEFAEQSDAVVEAWFIPDTPGLIKNNEVQTLENFEGSSRLALQKADNFNPTKESVMSGLLFKNPPWEEGKQAIEITLPLTDEASASALPTTLIEPATSYSLLLTIITAFLGGIILNIMPCVFPVLSLKVLGFIDQSGKHASSIRKHSFIFALGVLSSFWVLTLIVFFLRSTGEHVGWGFQLQNPDFVVTLYLLLILIALNLFGVFEFGTSLQRLGGAVSKNSNGYSGSFFSGVLTTILATPCTAPFIGSAVAFALSGSFLENLLIFTSIGLGLAAPYVLLSNFPLFLRHLPRPGAWMEIFKQAMGFPILLTALWLLHVLQLQAGADSVIVLLLASVILAVSVWVLGLNSTPLASRRRRRIGQGAALLGIISAFALCLPVQPPVADQSNTNQAFVDEYGLEWLPFSKTLMAEQRLSGKPVFVDFTARWCVTCQVNKKLVFSSSEIRRLIKAKEVILIRADWTRYDTEITESLNSFGKAGVPLNLLYFPNVAEPLEFPSLLSRSMIQENLEKL